MITVSALFDAYLDVNALLIFACALCFLLGLVLRSLGMGHTVTTQLRLMRLAFLAVVISPLFIAAYSLVRQIGFDAPASPVNLSDFIVSQYLQGRFQMNPSMLEEVLGWRGELVEAVVDPTGRLGPLFWALTAGIGVFTVRLAISVVRLRRMIGESYVWRKFGTLELRLSDAISIPFSTRGWRRRFVVLPSGMLGNDVDLRIALGHELQHLRQRDVEWEIVLEFLRPLFFWNPAFYLWKRKTELLRELACDRQVMARRGYDVAAYCQCLLSVCQSSLRRKRLFAVEPPVVALVRNDNRAFSRRSSVLLRNRLISLIEGRSERFSAPAFLALSAPLFGLMLVASLSIQKPGDWSQDRIMLSTIVNLERLAVINNSTLAQPQGF